MFHKAGFSLCVLRGKIYRLHGNLGLLPNKVRYLKLPLP